jgi:hypothetical protein
MKPSDRYLAIFSDTERKKIDRVPRFVQGVKDDFQNRWEEELFDNYNGELLFNTHFDGPMVLGFDAVFAGLPSGVRHELVELEDKMGKKHMVGLSGQVSREGTTFYHDGILYTQENLDKLHSTLTLIEMNTEFEKHISYFESISDKIFPVPMIGGIFDKVWMAMGMVEFSKNYRKKTRLYDDIIKFYAEIMIANVEALINTTGNRAKVVNLLDDVAFKGRTMISVERWDQDLGPYYKKVCSMIHDAGMIAQLHTDGDITELIPSFQKVGFQGVQGWEGGANPQYINDYFPDFVVIGFGDVGEVLPFGTPDQIDTHVKGLMDALKENRHYIFGPSTVIVKEMPLKNVQLFISAAEKYGKY